MQGRNVVTERNEERRNTEKFFRDNNNNNNLRGVKMNKYIDVVLTSKPTDNFSGLQVKEVDKVTQTDVDAFIHKLDIQTIGEKMTFVQAILVNGFTIEETSSCVSAENYDEFIGAGICIKKIKEKVWELLGFLLQTALNGFVPEELVGSIKTKAEFVSDEPVEDSYPACLDESSHILCFDICPKISKEQKDQLVSDPFIRYILEEH